MTATPPSPSNAVNKIAIIDGYALLFRAYYSMPSSLTSQSANVPIGAVLGFVNMLLKLKRNLKGLSHIMIALDSGQKSFRNGIYPAYKANRPPAPEDLIPQFPIAREAVSAMGIPCVEEVGFEADDLIAHYAQKANSAGLEVDIVTSDKDIMQLVQDGKTYVYDPVKDLKYTEDEVYKKYAVRPQQIRDYLSLTGDSSDNIPGVKGIGPKGASTLLAEFETLDSIYQNIDSVKPERIKKLLTEGKESALLSQKLVSFDLGISNSQNLSTFNLQNYNFETLLPFLQKYNLNSVISKIGSDYQIDVSNYLTTAHKQKEPKSKTHPAQETFFSSLADTTSEPHSQNEDQGTALRIVNLEPENISKTIAEISQKCPEVRMSSDSEKIIIWPLGSENIYCAYFEITPTP